VSAPASFSRLMDLLLADAENVLTYIDDVLVHSQRHEQHLKHLADDRRVSGDSREGW
jgi:hypothetical protein